MKVKSYLEKLGWRRIGLAVLFFACAAILEIQSALQSAEFHKGIATGWWGWLLAFGGAALDYGQIGFPVAATIAWGKDKKMLSGLFWFLTLAVAGYSLFTSMTCNVNWNNESINEIAVHAQKNEIYQKSSTSFDIASSSAQQLQQRLNDKISSRKADEEKIKAEYVPKIESARKKKYIDQNNNGVIDSVREFEAERDKRILKLDADIEELQTKIDSKLGKLETSKKEMSAVVSSTRPTRGLMGIAWLISKEDPDSIALRINIIKESLIVLAGIGFSIGVGIMLDSSKRFLIPQVTPPPTAPDDKPRKKYSLKPKFKENLENKNPLKDLSKKTNPEPTTAKLRVIRTKQKKFDEQVKAYVAAMEETATNDICIGYQRIAKRAGLTDNQGKEVYGHLKKIGLITVVNGQTKIVRKKSHLA